MDRKPLQEDPTPQTTDAENMEAQNEKAFLEPQTFMDDINYHKMADFMGVDYDARKDSSLAEKLSWLYDWAEEMVGSSEREDVYKELQMFKKFIANDEKGLDAINKMYKWTRLEKDKWKITQKMKTISIEG